MMKKEYNPETIAKKAAIKLIGQKELRQLLRSQTCALLALDMQEYFLNSVSHAFVPSAESVVPKLEQLARLCLNRRIPIIFTRHLNNDENAGMMKLWWRDMIRANSSLSEIRGSLLPYADYIIEKPQYDAFYETELKDRLEALGVDTLIVCGVMTHLCVESTARSGFVQGYRIILPVDGTATYNEQFHRASVLNLGHGFAHISSISDLIEAIENV